MNLASIIELYGGGPGSGCNPEVASPRCGRPAGAGGDTSGPSKAVHDYVESFQPVFQAAAQKFKQAVGNLGLVEGRLKSEASAQEKMDRKGYKSPNQMEDIAGLRVTVNSMQELTQAVAKIKQTFPVTWEEDKISNPTGGVYRAYHMTIEQDGKPVEAQVRTQNQSKVAIWMHNTIYKGELKNQKPALDYAKQISDYMHNLDMGGRIGSLPSCPPSVPCFNENMPFVQHLI